MQCITRFKSCRQKHDDVLEWIMFLNLHADMLYSIIWGDKDTYRLAFHLAGKDRGFSQVINLLMPESQLLCHGSLSTCRAKPSQRCKIHYLCGMPCCIDTDILENLSLRCRAFVHFTLFLKDLYSALRHCLQVDRRPSNAMTAPFLFPPPLNLRKPDSEDAQLQKVLESNGRKEKSEEVG